jgi:hypothetical protein
VESTIDAHTCMQLMPSLLPFSCSLTTLRTIDQCIYSFANVGLGGFFLLAKELDTLHMKSIRVAILTTNWNLDLK